MDGDGDKIKYSKVRFWLLTLDTTLIGLVAVFYPLPIDIRSVILTTAQELPGGVRSVGSLFLALGLALLIAGTTSARLLRVVHAIAAGIYTFYALFLLAAMLVGELFVAASGIHIIVVAWLHFEAGTEQPRLKGDDS